ncbi:hypothetical protein [uncultured Rossellomorea sp.]|uniref:hypothetical protein n=1 Tax=uncultured Rossellomorea sp. TaxID=2837549 RepID=UPI002630F288|nr:hypothetical protein [uncultured Rossellomorea sp.]
METVPTLNLSLDEMRLLVLEAFKTENQTQYLSVCRLVANIAVNKGFITNLSKGSYNYGGSFQLSSVDQDKVREIIWYLVFERVITIGINADNASWPWLKLTDYGIEVVNSEAPIPHDPSGYLERIKLYIPEIDQIILTYLEESLKTYNIGALLSSTITLGCASERALLILIDAFSNFFQESDRKEKFIKETQGKVIKRQFDHFYKNLNGVKGKLPGDITDGLDTMLLGIFEMIRNYRNDAGHPSGTKVSRDQVYANLQVFIAYCKKIYQLKHYFTHNKI